VKSCEARPADRWTLDIYDGCSDMKSRVPSSSISRSGSKTTIMKKLLTIACLFVVTTVATVSFIAPTVFGQEKKTPTVNSPPAESVTARVDKLFAQWDRSDSPGCALGIVKDGQLIYKRGYGMANLDYNIPISPQSIFNIESMAKQFTGMSILLLVKQGKLSLDDEIQKYLPDFPRYQSPITIRHLIHHTSGIREGLASLAGMRPENVHLTADDFLGLIARHKELNFKPGEEYAYSNSGYFLLGLIVKKVTGKSLRGFAEENIFKPLGMSNTQFVDDRHLVIKNRVTAYLPTSNGGFSAAIPYDDTLGDGGVFTSVEDLFHWDQNFYNNKLGGGPDLISEELSTSMLNNGKKINYAFGLQVGEYKGLKTIGHGGDGGGFETRMISFPEQNFSVICLCNADNINTRGLANQVADIFLADQFKKVPEAVKETAAAAPAISIPEKELTSLAGVYFDPIKLNNHSYYMKDGKLMIFNTALAPISQNRFKVVGGGPPGLEIVFVRPIAGGPMQVKHVVGDNTTTYYALQSVTPAQLAEFTGRYVSDELPGVTYTLSIKDGKLLLQVRNGITVFSDQGQALVFTQGSGSEVPKDNLLTPAFADAFIILDESFMLRFTRNQQNAISGFTLTTESVRRLRFNKL
jgi:CubicO group peptidase (beta-lactamase class C family)